MQMRKRGMSVFLFSFLWLAITGGTILSALHFSRLHYRAHGLTETGKELIPATGSWFRNNRSDWRDIPKIFESSFQNSAEDYDKNDGVYLPEPALNVLESLCKLIMSGTEKNLREVFPPEYIDSLEDKYGTVINIVGGFDNAIKQIMNLSFGSTIEKIGSVQTVTYEIEDFECLYDESFNKAIADLRNEGVSCKVDIAYKIKLILVVQGDKGTNSLNYNCVLFKTEKSWFLSPSGLAI